MVLQSAKSVIHNFNSGPSILPKEVFEKASQAIIDFNNSGLSILEIGHRTTMFQEVMDEARSLVRVLMNLDNDHEVLFLHGGATTQFMQVPMNMVNENDIASYTETGTWSKRPLKRQSSLPMLRSQVLQKRIIIEPSRKIFQSRQPPLTCISPLMKQLREHNGITSLIIMVCRW